MQDYQLSTRQQWIRQQQRSFVELLSLWDIGLYWALDSVVTVVLVVW